MNPHTHLQQRTGGKFGPKLPPPEPLTAGQELARLQALRDANGGLLVPMPRGIAGAQLVEPSDPDGRAAGQLVPNAGMKAALSWLQAIAEIGGPLDLELAWQSWPPVALHRHLNPKLHLLSTFAQLQATAGLRYAELIARAEEEGRDARTAESLRRQLRSERAEEEALARKHEAASAKADKTAAALATVERRMRGEAEQ